MEPFVVLSRDLPVLEKFLSRPAGRPRLVDDANAMALAQRGMRGNASVWGKNQMSPLVWSLTSLNIDGTGVVAESITPPGADDGTAPPPEDLQALLQQVDPAALFSVAMAWSPNLAALRRAANPNVLTPLDQRTKEATGLALWDDILPQLSGGEVFDVAWVPSYPPSTSPLAFVSELQVVLSLDVRDGAAALALVERCRAHMIAHKELGRSLELTSVQVGNEQVPVYALRSIDGAAPVPAPAAQAPVPKKNGRRSWMQPSRSPPVTPVPRGTSAPQLPSLGRVAVWHKHLILTWGDEAMTRVLGYLGGHPSRWLEQNKSGLIGKHLDGRTMLSVWRGVRVADAIAKMFHTPPAAPRGRARWTRSRWCCAGSAMW